MLHCRGEFDLHSSSHWISPPSFGVAFVHMTLCPAGVVADVFLYDVVKRQAVGLNCRARFRPLLFFATVHGHYTHTCNDESQRPPMMPQSSLLFTCEALFSKHRIV